MGDWIENRLLTHIWNVWRCKYEVWVYPFFHIALLNDFGSFALCMCESLIQFDSAHSSTASPSLSVEVYPQSVLWLLKSPIIIWGMFLFPSGGSMNYSAGGLYTECTITPGSSTVMHSTLSSSQTEILLTFRPSLTKKTELPCLLCGRSATSAMLGMLGLAWSLALWVSWRHRQWQCLSLHNSDSMDALLAVRPSMFADITIRTSEEFWLCMADI